MGISTPAARRPSVAGQVALDNGFIGSYGASGVSIVAKSVGLDDGSVIRAYAPTSNVEMVISGGSLTLDNGSHVIAGNDVLLTLTGADAQVVLNSVAGETPSTIETQFTDETTHIGFLGRTADGIVIDGVDGTTTVGGGSGFYALGSPASIGNGLVITYGSDAASNIASQTIDQFFANLTDNKKKKADTGDSNDKSKDKDNQGGVGQCT